MRLFKHVLSLSGPSGLDSLSSVFMTCMILPDFLSCIIYGSSSSLKGVDKIVAGYDFSEEMKYTVSLA